MPRITPEQVRSTLSKHMFVDGYADIVVDLQKSEGHYIYDSLNQRRFLDLFSYFASAPVGHNHPSMNDAEFQEKLLNAAIGKPSNSDFYTTEMAEFVQSFSKHVIPKHLAYLFLVSGGALAVENALKTAFDWKVRKNIAKGGPEKGSQVVHLREAFHGRSGYTLSLTNTERRKTKYFPKFSWPRIANPKITFPLADNLDKVVERERKAVEKLKNVIHECGDDIAAIILEPIQGEGGDNHFRTEFFQQLRTLADENEILLIFDEVQTGIGMTGKMWCYEHFGVEPDMLVFGKKTQVCGFLCSKRIEEVDNHVFEESSRINSTWGGNLVDMVRMTKYIEIIEAENLVENAREVGEYFLAKLIELQPSHDSLISNVRGRGLMIAFDLPNADIQANFLNAAYEEGMIILGCGERAVRFRPALNMTRAVVDDALGIVRVILKKIDSCPQRVAVA